MDLSPEVVTRDLHASVYAEDNVMTEYEANFVSQGMKIHMLRVKKPIGYLPHYTEPKRAKEKEEEDTLA